MRRVSLRGLGWVAAGVALAVLTACAPVDPSLPAAEEPVDSVTTTEDSLAARSKALLSAVRDRDARTIAGFIHPAKGVRLSPYAYVEKVGDQVLTAAQFVEAFNDEAPRWWGVEDATGDPLMMSCADYFGRFVYDADFMEAKQTSIGTPIGRGNTINNAAEAYPAATIVEYHFPGFDPQYEGLDWRSLRLVFEQAEGDWFLVGIIHDEWTS